MSLPISVAKEFLRLADTDGDPLTKMQLQKLLFYAQAWSMVLRDTDLIDEDFEAWTFGPVIPSLWREFAGVSSNVVPVTDNPHAGLLSADDRRFLRAVWESYRDYSPSRLSKMTHEEQPYLAARKGLPVDAPSSEVIDPAGMADYYSRQTRPAPLRRYEELLRQEEREAEEWLAARRATGRSVARSGA